MAFEVNYTALDKLLHRIAFVSPAIQRMMADVEDSVFRGTFKDFAGPRPVFITSLPRAGTTLLLDSLSTFHALAPHTYRDMPFVLAPILWSRLSQPFSKKSEYKERAHGDGMKVGFDSPEAFEEIFWKSFWPQHYSRNNIALWEPQDGTQEAAAFLRTHMQKIISLRCPECSANGRYVSKNNANIARVALIRSLFPDADIVIPVRDPIQHAASLQRQHLNFIEQHKTDKFVRRYMADIGHFEFGELHRPIAFPGLAELINGRDPTKLDYWLAYWIAAFEYVNTFRNEVVLLSYEKFCREGRSSLANLCDRLHIEPGDVLESTASKLHEPSCRQVDTAGVPRQLIKRAEDVHRSLVGDS